MPKRTYPHDAGRVEEASDLEDVVQDKRAVWRATGANGRRWQRRYKNFCSHKFEQMDPQSHRTRINKKHRRPNGGKRNASHD